MDGQMTALSQPKLLHCYSGPGNAKEWEGQWGIIISMHSLFLLLLSAYKVPGTSFFTYTVSFCLPLEVGVIYYLHFTDEATDGE